MSKVLLQAHIDEKVYKRLDEEIRKAKKVHGAKSEIVEKALREHLGMEEK